MVYNVDLKQIEEYNTHQSKINPKRAALLVIEMQNVFLKDLAIIIDSQMANIHSLISTADAQGTKVIFIRHNDSSEISKSMVDWWGGDKIEKGSEGWKMIDGFDTTNRIVIDKNQYSAFHRTNLDEVLKANNIEDLIITGVMTNCCCETTAREAFMYGYRVFFINDATSTFTEELHLATLKNLAFGFAYVQNTQELIQDMMGEAN